MPLTLIAGLPMRPVAFVAVVAVAAFPVHVVAVAAFPVHVVAVVVVPATFPVRFPVIVPDAVMFVVVSPAFADMRPDAAIVETLIAGVPDRFDAVVADVALPLNAPVNVVAVTDVASMGPLLL